MRSMQNSLVDAGSASSLVERRETKNMTGKSIPLISTNAVVQISLVLLFISRINVRNNVAATVIPSGKIIGIW